jgi:maltose O-acetyltransferase
MFRRIIWKLVNYIQLSDLTHYRIRRLILNLSGCKISPSSQISSGTFFGSNNVNIYENVFININCFFDGSDLIEVHSFVRIGPYVKILTGSHEYTDSVIRRDPSAPKICKPVIIGRGCWIGIGSTILPGVTIAEGCVIAAGSVVTKSTEKNGLYAGVPARRIKKLSIQNDTKL